MNKKAKIATLIISSNTYPATRNIKAQKKIYLKFQKNIFWYRQGNKDQLNGTKANLINNDLFLSKLSLMLTRLIKFNFSKKLYSIKSSIDLL